MGTSPLQRGFHTDSKEDAHRPRVGANTRGRKIEAAGGKFKHRFHLLRVHMKLLNDFVKVGACSRFSKIAETGIRVPFKTHAPPILSGTLSTARHWNQSSVAMCLPSFHCSFFKLRKYLCRAV
jgi:hypothetical protein